MSSLATIRRQAAEVRRAQDDVDRRRIRLYWMIRGAWPRHSLAEIAEAAGVTRARIQAIIRKA